VSLQTKQLMNITVENEQLKQEVMNLKQVIEKLTEDIGRYQIGTPLCPVELTMTNFEQHKKDGDKWYSPPFYTHTKGYKMCLLVYAGGNGGGVNTHVSVFLLLMKGEYDDQLKWPLGDIFTIQLLSQDGEEGQCLKIVVSNIDGYSRVVDGERSRAQLQTGKGQQLFIAHTELIPKYLQNNRLKFYIEVMQR
jgi:hypothetical protein